MIVKKIYLVIPLIILLSLSNLLSASNGNYHLSIQWNQDKKESMTAEIDVFSQKIGQGLEEKFQLTSSAGEINYNLSTKSGKEQIHDVNLLEYFYQPSFKIFYIQPLEIPYGKNILVSLFNSPIKIDLSNKNAGERWNYVETVKLENGQSIELIREVILINKASENNQILYDLLISTNANFNYNGDAQIWPSNVNYSEKSQIKMSDDGDLALFEREQTITTSSSGGGGLKYAHLSASEKHEYTTFLNLEKSGISKADLSRSYSKQKYEYGQENEYITFEEFNSSGAENYWYNLIFKSDLISQKEMGSYYSYNIKPECISFASSNSPTTTTYIEEGIKPIHINRNSSNEHIEVKNKNSIFCSIVNDLLDNMEINNRQASWQETYNLQSIKKLGLSQIASCKINFQSEIVASKEGNNYLLIEFDSNPFEVTSKNSTLNFSHQFTGFSLLDVNKTKAFYTVFKYQGKIESNNSGYSEYSGQQISHLINSTNYNPVISTDDIPKVKTLLNSFKLINDTRSASDYTNLERSPAWLPILFGISRETQIASSVYGEQKSNLWPIVAVVLGAHILDDAYTFGANMGHDLANIVSGEEGAKFNPFDGDEESLLQKYFYEPGARGYVETATDIGWIDPSKIEAYTKVGGSLLKLPIDIINLFANPHQLWGSASHLSGLSKSSTIMLGKLHYAASLKNNPYVKAVNLYSFINDLASTGQTIVDLPKTTTAHSPQKQPEIIRPKKFNTTPYIIGGGLLVAAGGGAAYYLINENMEDIFDNLDNTGGLSDVVVNSRYITLTVYDHGLIDGDQIDVIVNGSYKLQNFILDGPPGETINVTLRNGSNTVKVHADNEGSVSPNTATIVISNVVSGLPEQVWSLGLGEDASFTVSFNSAAKAANEFFPEPISHSASFNLSPTLKADYGYFNNRMGNQDLYIDLQKNIGNNTSLSLSYRDEKFDQFNSNQTSLALQSSGNTFINSYFQYNFILNNTIINQKSDYNNNSIYRNMSMLNIRSMPIKITDKIFVNTFLSTRQILTTDKYWDFSVFSNTSTTYKFTKNMQFDISWSPFLDINKYDNEINLLSNQLNIGSTYSTNSVFYSPKISIDLHTYKIEGLIHEFKFSFAKDFNYYYYYGRYSMNKPITYTMHQLSYKFNKDYIINFNYQKSWGIYTINVQKLLNHKIR